MKPPFSYYGGKQRLASRIVPLLPPHTVYNEAYAGAGTVLFKKALPIVTSHQHYREVLNDHNGHIINFFRVLQNSAQNAELYRRLKYTLYSSQEFKLARDLLINPVDDPLTMAWAWFVSIQLTYAHDLTSTGMRYSLISNNPATSFRSSSERIEAYRERLELVFIEQMKALDCIKKWDSPQTCHFIDSPYPGVCQGHYDGFTQKDFEELIDVLKACEGSAVVCCYENPAIPDDWVRHEFKALAGSAAKGKADRRRVELVFVKPTAGQMRKELQPIAKGIHTQFQGSVSHQLALSF